MRANFVWDLPDLKSSQPALRAIGIIANDWQLSGIWSGTTSTAYTVGITFHPRSIVRQFALPAKYIRLANLVRPAAEPAKNRQRWKPVATEELDGFTR